MIAHRSTKNICYHGLGYHASALGSGIFPIAIYELYGRQNRLHATQYRSHASRFRRGESADGSTRKSFWPRKTRE